jgi:hypothetical protein
MNDAKIIALAADTSLYAPLYIAKEAGFFGDVPVVFGKLKRSAPQHVALQPQSLPQARSATFLDRHVQAVWQGYRHDKSPLLTICDPMHALLHNLRPGRKSETFLVGAILARPACWFFDGVSSFDVFLSRLRSDKSRRIRTHPPGMTADTMIRWILLKRAGFTLDEIAGLIEPVGEPGEELDAFATGSGTSITHKRGDGAVSINLIEMRQLEERSEGRLGICKDFSAMMPNYLMTGIVVGEEALDEDKSSAKMYIKRHFFFDSTIASDISIHPTSFYLNVAT